MESRLAACAGLFPRHRARTKSTRGMTAGDRRLNPLKGDEKSVIVMRGPLEIHRGYPPSQQETRHFRDNARRSASETGAASRLAPDYTCHPQTQFIVWLLTVSFHTRTPCRCFSSKSSLALNASSRRHNATQTSIRSPPRLSFISCAPPTLSLQPPPASSPYTSSARDASPSSCSSTDTPTCRRPRQPLPMQQA